MPGSVAPARPAPPAGPGAPRFAHPAPGGTRARPAAPRTPSPRGAAPGVRRRSAERPTNTSVPSADAWARTRATVGVRVRPRSWPTAARASSSCGLGDRKRRERTWSRAWGRRRTAPACVPTEAAAETQRSKHGPPLSPTAPIARVEEDHGRASPGGFVLADHELAGSRDAAASGSGEGRRPLDRAASCRSPRPCAGAGACASEPDAAPKARPRGPLERLDLGRDDDLVSLLELGAPAREAERVDDIDPSGPERPAASPTRPMRVYATCWRFRAGIPGRTSRAGGPSAAGTTVLDEQERGRRAGPVLDPQLDGDRRAGRDPRLRQPAVHHEVALGPAHDQQRDERQHDEPDGDHVHGRGADDARRRARARARRRGRRRRAP